VQIITVLKETKGASSGPNGAAMRLGVKRSTLLYRMTRLGINARDMRLAVFPKLVAEYCVQRDERGGESVWKIQRDCDMMRVPELSLQEAMNEIRKKVWAKKEKSFLAEGIVALRDLDGTIAGTTGECKGGMDMSYKGSGFTRRCW